MEELREEVTCPECHQVYGSYTSRLLPCLHTFCVDCLTKLPVQVSNHPAPQASDQTNYSNASSSSDLQENGTSGGVLMAKLNDTVKEEKNELEKRSPSKIESTKHKYIECPKCQTQCTLPTKGIDGFQSSVIISDRVTNFKSLESLGREGGPKCCHCHDSPLAIAYCERCRYFICEGCSRMHQLWQEYKSHQIVKLEDLMSATKDHEKTNGKEGVDAFQKKNLFLNRPPKLQDIPCFHHSKEKIKFYCCDCRELLCHDCYIVDHRTHAVQLITPKLLDEHRQEMASIRSTLCDTTQSLEAMCTNTTNEKEALKKSVGEVRALIITKFDELEKSIQARKEELLKQLAKLESEPLSKLDSRLQKIDTLLNQVNKSIRYIERNLSDGGPTAMLSVERTVKENNDALCSAIATIPDVEPSPPFQFTIDNQLLNFIASHGNFGADLSKDECLMETSFNSSDQPPLFLSLPNSVCCDLESSSSEFTQSTETDQLSQLSIPSHINGPRINGDAVRTIDDLDHPCGLTSANFLIVCEYGSNHSVSILSHQGILIRKIGQMGEKDGEFIHPQCIAIDSSERLYVTDSVYRFQVFDSNGMWLKTVGTRGKGELQFKDPVGIAIGPNRHMFVVERENSRIQVLKSDLSHHKFIGRKGNKPCEFNQPSDIAVSTSGLLYIVDSWNHRIQVLTQEGEFVYEFGCKGKSPGCLLSPSHICIDPDGFVFVSEHRLHRVSMFTLQGEFVKVIGEEGSGLGQLFSPRGVAIDLNKILYVCDYGNNRIHIFK